MKKEKIKKTETEVEKETEDKKENKKVKIEKKKKKKIKISNTGRAAIIFFIIALFACFPYLNKSNVYSHDIGFHLNRLNGLAEGIKVFDIPHLVDFNMLKGLGYATPLFYPELFLYLPAMLMSIFGISVMTAYKIMIFLISFFTLFFMYIALKGMFKKETVSYFGSIIYTFSLYRIVNIFIRGAVGELFAMMFLPLIIYGLYEIIVGDNKKWWILTIGLFGIGNSHILSFIFSIVLVIVICLVFAIKIFKEKKRMHNLFVSVLVSVVLCLGFYGPFLEQYLSGKYTSIYTETNEMREMAASLSDIFNGSLKFGYLTPQEDKDAADTPVFSLGIGLVIILLAGCMFITKKDRDKESNKFMESLFLIGSITYLCATNLFPWNKFDCLQFMQFPFRLNIIATICLSFVAAKCTYDFVSNKRDSIFILSFVILLFTGYLMSGIKPNLAGAMSDKYWSIEKEEHLMMGSDGIEILGGREYVSKGTVVGDIKTYYYNNGNEIESYRDGKKLSFTFDGEKNNEVVKVPLIYYKGYKAYIKTENGKKYNLKVEKDDKTGQILVSGGSGLKGTVTVEYKMTFIQFICYTISTIAFIAFVVYIVKDYKKSKEKSEKEEEKYRID